MPLSLLKISMITYFVALMGTFVWIKILEKFKTQQIEREEGPQSHKAKEGTPTMGGVIIVLVILLSSLFFIKPNFSIFLLYFSALSFAILGLVDDFAIVKFGSNQGIRPRTRFLLQILLALIFVGLLILFKEHHLTTAGFLAQIINHHLWLYFVFALFVIIASVNAVNLTDGLDGLAPGTLLPPFIFLIFKALSLKQTEIFLFLVILSSVLFAFLFFNKFPAKIFMGNVGSYALGAVLGAVAVLLHQELMLLIIGGVFVLETLSVIMQVIYFKITRGRRIFLMSPLHHHFELWGWSEVKVVRMFWTASLLFMFLGLFISG